MDIELSQEEKYRIREVIERELDGINELKGKISFNLDNDEEHDAFLLKNVEDFNKRLLESL